MSRLPTVSGDGNAWGTILNDFLSQAHNADGSIKNYYTNVKDPAYGAKGDGITDDTTAIKAAIAAVATSGGTVFFPTGTYMVASALVIPSAVTLQGVGKLASVIKKSANCDLIDASGTATGTATHCVFPALRHLSLHGGNFTGKLLRTYYTDNLICDSVYFQANGDMAIETTELWDSYFLNCSFLFCGDTAGVQPAVYLKNAATASGYGYSTDSTNMIWFVNCRWEQFYAGALWIAALNGNVSTQGGIYLVNCKMETAYVSGGPFLSVGGYVVHFHLTNLYIEGFSFNTGFSTPVPAIGFYGGSNCTFDNVEAGAGAAVFSSIIEYWANGDPTKFTNVFNTGTAPTVSLINFTGGATNHLYLENIQAAPGTTAFHGTPPNIGSLQNKVTAPAYATPYTPDVLNNGDYVVISPVTGVLTINAPATQWAGALLTFLLTSNATGNYALTWNAIYKAAGGALPPVMLGPNATLAVAFKSDGTNWWLTSTPAPVQSATAVVIAASAAIATAGLDVSRLAPSAARIGITMQAGTYAGQKCYVINESAFVLTYNATPATSLIANSAVVTALAINTGRLFVWDSSTSLWY